MLVVVIWGILLKINTFSYWNATSVFFFLMFIHFWDKERETESEQGRGRERGTNRIQSRLLSLSCQHRAWHRAWTHKPRDYDLSWSQMLNRLSHPSAPLKIFSITWSIYINNLDQGYSIDFWVSAIFYRFSIQRIISYLHIKQCHKFVDSVQNHFPKAVMILFRHSDHFDPSCYEKNSFYKLWSLSKSKKIGCTDFTKLCCY